MKVDKRWDVFISHAGSDKEPFVLPLAEALRSQDISVWFDTWAIELGDGIMSSISEGLTQSRFGIVVLSPSFFSRAWPKKELEALFAHETNGTCHIIPIWYNVEHADVLMHAPLLADKMAARADEGIPSIVQRIVRLLARENSTTSGLNSESLRALTKQLFPSLPINEFWQTHLLANLDVALYRSPSDIERAYRRARPAVEAFAREQPWLFRTGTDYLTKSLGFVDLCFRSRHNWVEETEEAFERHAGKVDWELKGGNSLPRYQ